ncbi:MAG: hypothetical protein IPH18_02595 [Chitinophagaceae bacterium]|nr:hypothetical protein [Chitinophagaceae bacterium]MBK8951758.1 hypothetical protein [Chitinophagaceae bacterium]
MKKIILLISIMTVSATVYAQKVDSIYFHLYTDSLKKGQHNYINVDGKLTNGRWLPLTSKELILSCTEAVFEGNELIIPIDFQPEKVTVKAVLRKDPSVLVEKIIWIKTAPDPELPTKAEIMNNPAPSPGNKRKN